LSVTPSPAFQIYIFSIDVRKRRGTLVYPTTVHDGGLDMFFFPSITKKIRAGCILFIHVYNTEQAAIRLVSEDETIPSHFLRGSHVFELLLQLEEILSQAKPVYLTAPDRNWLSRPMVCTVCKQSADSYRLFSLKSNFPVKYGSGTSLLEALSWID
jgi:hypothetical protein